MGVLAFVRALLYNIDMANLKFTDKQREAIETLDKSILVSAAAGSGKTAVLIQRIVNIILKGEADVDEMLIVTFTNAAAAEMRLKLYKEIKRRMQDCNDEERERLKFQLDKLYRAYISTFNSFAIRIIKEFFYEIDIDPKFAVCDEVKASMLQYEAIDSLFEEAFDCDDLIEGGSFTAFLRLYSSDRSEKEIKEKLIGSYVKLRSMPDYFSWAHDKARLLKLTESGEMNPELERIIVNSCLKMLCKVESSILEIGRIFDEAGIIEMYNEKLLPEAETVKSLIEKLNTDGINEDFFEKLKNIEFQTLRAKKDYKEAYAEIKDRVKSLRDAYKKEVKDWVSNYCLPSFDERLKEMDASYEYTEYYIKLLEEFEKRFALLKKEAGLLDFSDTEHNAAAILKNDELAEILRNRFKFIFIDEYQDTNNIQEALIQRISRRDNVFKVGDVKQSIYRFRQAEPEIFENTYREYADVANGDAKTIDLNANFRCNSKTIDYINCIFEDAMEAYDDAAKLYAGLSGCPDEFDFIPETHILLQGEEPETEMEEETEQDDSLEELSRNEAEAEYVADLISNLVGTEFYDTKTGEHRKVCPRDIVILLRAVKNRGDVFARALRSRELQSHVEESEEYFDTVEVKLALSLLMSIDNFKRDVPLIATLHSEIFAFSAEELGVIRAEYRMNQRESGEEYRRTAYWEAASWYAKNGSDGDIKAKLNAAIEKLGEWKNLSRMMPLSDFIWKVLSDSNYYLYSGAMYGGSRRQANLRALVDRANSFAGNSVVSLGSFIKYLEVMKGKKIGSGQASMVGKDDDVVRISTIHKSKGLEYPFVIVAGLGNTTRKDGKSKDLSFDTKIGLGLPYVSPDKKYWRSTVLQNAVYEKIAEDERKEALRVLYVALTRARNKLILVGSIKVDKQDEILEGYGSDNTYYGVVGRNLKSPYNRCFIKSLDTKTHRQRMSRASSLVAECKEGLSDASIRAGELYAEIDRRLSFTYPDDEMKIKAKYSVSELRRASLEAEAGLNAGIDNGSDTDEGAGLGAAFERRVKYSGKKQSKDRSSAADIGNAYHRIMEQLDFAKCLDESGDVNCDYIKSQAEQLLEAGAIEEKVFEELKLESIYTFFEGEIGRRAADASAAGKLYKEKPFVLAMDKDGHRVLVQGVVDCCFEEAGKMVLIDYKSSYIDEGADRQAELERIKREYITQIDIYADAISKGTGLELKEAFLYIFAIDEALSMK